MRGFRTLREYRYTSEVVFLRDAGRWALVMCQDDDSKGPYYKENKMALMEWSEKLSVNIKEVDEQHKKWIKLLNDLHDAMKSGKGNEVIGSTLSGLVEYTKVHFATEEKLLQSHSYPAFLAHKKLHTEMVAKVESLESQYKSGKPVLSVEVMQFLKNWLSEHIVGTDKNYGPYLNSKGVH